MSSATKRSPRKNHSGVPFKAYAAKNRGKISARFPFLKEEQIRSKLLSSWRRARGIPTTKCSPQSSQESAPEEKTGCNTIRESAKVEHRNEVQDTSVVLGLFKPRVKEIIEASPPGNVQEPASRLLPSKECESNSNFHMMFDNEDDIFD